MKNTTKPKIDLNRVKKVMTASEKRDSLQKPGPRIKRKKRASGPKEGVIQEQVEAYLTLKGIRFLHIPDIVYRLCAPYSPIKVWEKAMISRYLKGTPDLLIFKKDMISDEVECMDNSCLMLELKRKNEKARQAQRAWHKGLVVHIPQSFEEARELIDHWAE